MNMQRTRIAGFMSAESIYSLAFYIVMVAAIAGVGASVLTNKDSAKAAAAISLLRANYVAESAGLGYTPPATAVALYRMSGNLLVLDIVPATPTVTLPGGSGLVTMGVRGTGAAPLAPLTGFTISVMGIVKPAICSAVAGVGHGTWTGLAFTTAAAPLPGPSVAVSHASKTTLKTACDAATASAPVNLLYISD